MGPLVEGIWEEAAGRHLGGGIWEQASGRHLRGNIWENASERMHLARCIWEKTSGRKHLGGCIWMGEVTATNHTLRKTGDDNKKKVKQSHLN